MCRPPDRAGRAGPHMIALNDGWLSRMLRQRAARRWARLQSSMRRNARPLDPELRDQARDLHQLLGQLLQLSDGVVAGARGSLARMQLPAGTDWRWRPRVMQAANDITALAAPENGRWLSPEVALFHDCPNRALILRQSRNRHATDLADYALALEVMGFGGRYLSFSLGLPAEALEGLGSQNILRLDASLQAERPIVVYARLNLQQGPNTEQMLRQMGDPIGAKTCTRVIEFDLGYANLAARPVEKAWIDVIFDAPFMNAVTLRDVVVSRHTRAQI